MAHTGEFLQTSRPTLWRGRWRRRIAVAAMLASVSALSALALPAGAAAVGELSFGECFGTASGCLNIAGNPLTQTAGVAVSPDGTAVYATGFEYVSHFFADPASGRLSYDGCLTDEGGPLTCTPVKSSAKPFKPSIGVAVDPTGAGVFTTSTDEALVTQLFRAPTGQLTYGGCISEGGSGGACGMGSELSFADSVALNPAGTELYATASGGFFEGAISYMSVAPAGQLTYQGCISSGGSGGSCGLPSAPGGQLLKHPVDVAVSPDGGTVYVVSAGSGTLTRLSARPGQLTWVECLSDDGSAGSCTDVPGTPLEEVDSVAVSPDGSSVYTTSGSSAGQVSHFRVTPSGRLEWEGCYSSDGSHGCTDIPGSGSPLEFAEGVAVSPDGDSVYAAGASAVTSFTTGAGGELIYQGCVSSDPMPGCEDLPGSPLSACQDVTVSPGGGSVYVACPGSNALIHLTRALPSASGAGLTPRGPGTTSGGAGHVPTAAELRASLFAQLVPYGKAARLASLKRRGRYSYAFKALEAGTLTVSWYFVPHGAHVSRKGRHGPKPVLLGSGRVVFAAAGTKTLVLKLTGKGRSMLRRSTLKVTAKGTFAPAGVKAVSTTRSFTLKR